MDKEAQTIQPEVKQAAPAPTAPTAPMLPTVNFEVVEGLEAEVGSVVPNTEVKKPIATLEQLERYAEGSINAIPTVEKQSEPTKPDKSVEPTKPTKQPEQSPFLEVFNTPEVKQQEQQVKAGRDYTGLTNEEASWFKNMSNDAYNALRPLYGKLKQKDDASSAPKQETTSSSLYENEEAFVLTPAFKTTIQEKQTAELIQEHWREQFAKIRSGEKWSKLFVDDKGNYTVGASDNEATPQAEALILENLNKSSNYKLGLEQRLEQIKSHHVHNHRQAASVIKAAEEYYFPFYKDASNPHQPIIEDLLKHIPAPFRDSPLASFTAKSFALITHLKDQLATAREQIKSMQGLKEDIAKAGPSASGGTLGTSAMVQQSQKSQIDQKLKRMRDLMED